MFNLCFSNLKDYIINIITYKTEQESEWAKPEI